MSLTSGEKLGPYEVLAPLGAGGMGEVYRARDPRLDREVAIKVLPDTFARDKERVLRFEREAKVLASLSHPNIAAIYGFEEHHDVRFLVLELVEGQTLAERLERGPMPLNESLEVCKQIAEAVEAAHEQGIMHRDLKPANVKITPEGEVKVLDFGLAKTLTGEASGSNIANSPTITAEHTRPGVVLGTAAYMSPEQARGRSLDKRTDVWSFGCVLYECLVGRRPFEGETTSDVMAQILEREPDWTSLPGSTPLPVQRLLQRSLVKDRRKRLRDIGDAALELEEVLLGGTRALSPTFASVKPPIRRKQSVFLILVGLSAFALGLVLAAAIGRRVASPDRSAADNVARYTVTLPRGTTIGTGRFAPLGVERSSLTLSPDGKLLVFVGVTDGVSRLFLRRADTLDAAPLPQTEGAFDPFFSTDGQWIAFFADGKLKKVSPLGGVPVGVCEAPLPKGGSWGSDDRIVFSRDDGLEICVVSSGGGTPRSLLARGRGGPLNSPQWLEGGKWLLYTEEKVGVNLLSLESGEAHALLPRAEYGRYVPTGHLLYLQAGTVSLVPFSWPGRTLGDTRIPLEADIRSQHSGIPQMAYSKTGTLAYIPGGRVSGSTLVLVRPTGETVPLGCPARSFGTMDFSPDGRRLAIEVQDLGCDIWVYDLMRETFTRLTTDGTSRNPLWSPDGKSVMFSSTENDDRGIFARTVEGGGKRQLILSAEGSFDALSPDGRYAIVSGRKPETKGDLSVHTFGEPDTLRDFRNSIAHEWGAAFAPDGSHVAYVSDESGQYEVYATRFPDGDGTLRVSDGGGEEPVWAPGGDRLYYRNGDKWMAVPVQEGSEVRFGNPYLVFEGPYLNVWGRSYAVAPDTGNFLVIQTPTEEAPVQITVVLNWFEEIKGRFVSRRG